MTARGGALTVVLLVTLLGSLAACTSAERPSIQAEPLVLPTPMASLTLSVAATAGLLRGVLGEVGYRLDQPMAAYRPSEPESLLRVPRAVLRASLADPGEGHIVIYQLADAATARERAEDLAAYLASGFGQTNFAPDAQFSGAFQGDTVIFTSWSRARAADAPAAEAVFDGVARIGEPVEVLK
ncbi:hypothetical protein BH23CHL8_BH23CHL8_25130 [soil metagenome]